MTTRWILPFLVAALLLPPLPIGIGGAGPHPALLYHGLEVGLGTLARVALFGLSVYLFFFLTAGPARAPSADPHRDTALLFYAAAAAALFAVADF